MPKGKSIYIFGAEPQSGKSVVLPASPSTILAPERLVSALQCLASAFMRKIFQKWPILIASKEIPFIAGVSKPIQSQDVLVSCVAVIEL